MLRKLLIATLTFAVLVSLVPKTTVVKAQDDTITIAFVPGVNPDPFYVTMSAGVMQAAVDLGVEVVQQDPEEFNPTVI